MKYLIAIIGIIVSLLSITPQGAYAQINPPTLQCVNLLLDGSVEITWRPFTGATSCGAGFTSYNIYSATSETGPFNLVTNITDISQGVHVDASSIGTTNTLFYYVTSTCNTIESAPSDIVNTDFPVAPVLTSVEVLDTSIVQVNWQESLSPEAHGYIIYRADDNGSFLPIDTLFVSADNYYQDTTATPSLQPESYLIAAFDSCSVEPGPDNGLTHTTVHLTAANDSCNNQITFNWTGYAGWGADLEGYDIQNRTTAEIIGTVDLTTTTFTYDLPSNLSAACFAIIAKHINGVTISFSNETCIDVTQVEEPQFMYITNVSVVETGEVSMEWIADLTGINTLNIMQGATDSANLSSNIPFPLPDPLVPSMAYIDNSIQTDKYPYYYQLEHINSCNGKVFSSKAKTIWLAAQDQLNLNNSLDWTAFEIDYGVVNNYAIYRGNFDGTNFTQIANIGASELNYSDPIGDLGLAGTGFCYRIEARYTLSLPDGSTQNLSSFSNVVCVSQSSRVWVPNAFKPNGVNNVFKPIILYPNPDGYEMIIMNRWGEIVFKTGDPEEGWDGSHKNGKAPQGTYVYVIHMKSSTGYQIERKGSLVLVR